MTTDINHTRWDIRNNKKKADPSGKSGPLPWTSVVQMHLVSNFLVIFSLIYLFSDPFQNKKNVAFKIFF